MLLRKGKYFCTGLVVRVITRTCNYFVEATEWNMLIKLLV